MTVFIFLLSFVYIYIISYFPLFSIIFSQNICKSVLDKKNNVKTIFFEELVSPKVAEIIAKEVNAKTEELNPLESLSEVQIKKGEDYFSVMEENLQVLYEAIK